jgi:hypothetical protein
MKTWLRTSQARRIAAIVAVTIAVGGLGAKIVYDRVVHGNDAKNACERNLAWIAGAKGIAAKQHVLEPGTIVNQHDLELYMTGGWRSCPAGGTYTIGPIGTDPTCSVPGHALPK